MNFKKVEEQNWFWSDQWEIRQPRTYNQSKDTIAKASTKLYGRRIKLVEPKREEKVNQSLQGSREDDLWEPKGGIHWSPKVAPLHGNLLLYVNTYIDWSHTRVLHTLVLYNTHNLLLVHTHTLAQLNQLVYLNAIIECCGTLHSCNTIAWLVE